MAGSLRRPIELAGSTEQRLGRCAVAEFATRMQALVAADVGPTIQRVAELARDPLALGLEREEARHIEAGVGGGVPSPPPIPT